MRLSASLAVAVAIVALPGSPFVAPAAAATCSGVDLLDRPANDQTTSRQLFIAKSQPNLQSAYVGYGFSGTTFGTYADLWLKIDGFGTQNNVLSLAPNQSATIPVRSAAQDPAASAGSRVAYAYLSASGATNNKAQTVNLSVWNGNPNSGTQLCTFSESYTDVNDALNANANKVTGLAVSTTSPALGASFTVTTTGATGTIGNFDGNGTGFPGSMAVTPAQSNNWPADAFTLTGVSLKLGSGATQYDRLRYWPSQTSNQNYSLTYTFNARKTTTTTTSIVPAAYIASGSQTKYTGSYSGTAAGAVLQPVTQQISINKQLTNVSGPDTATVAGSSIYTATYRVQISNLSATSGATLDSLLDTLSINSGTSGGSFRPAPVVGATVSGSMSSPTTTLNGTVESASTNQMALRFEGPITVAPAASRYLTYSVSVMYPTGNASMPLSNNVVGYVGSTTVNATTGLNLVSADFKKTTTLTLNASANGSLAADLAPNVVTGAASGVTSCSTAGKTSGSVSCTYMQGLVLNVTATPSTGVTVATWSVSPDTSTSTCLANSTVCVTGLTRNETITANFANAFTVTVNGVTNGSVSDGSLLGFDCSATTSCVKTYGNGAAPTITVTANSNYRLTALTQTSGTGFTCSAASGQCAGTVTGNVTLQATVLPLYALDITVFDVGTVTPSVGTAATSTSGASTLTTNTYTAGTTVTLTASSATRTFQGWGGACSGTATTCTLTINAYTAVSASFLPVMLTGSTTPSDGSHGTISVDTPTTDAGGTNSSVTLLGCSDSSTANCSDAFAVNTVISMSAAPATGYNVGTWTVSGSTPTAGSCAAGSLTCSFTLTAATTVRATFVIKTYRIVATAGANGNISPPDTTTVNYGASQTYTLSPSARYHVATLTVDGVSTAAVSSYSFTNVTSDHTIAATFAMDTYTITASASANGSISPSGVTTLNSGASQTYTITPNSGYYVSGLIVDGLAVTPATTYAFSSISANHTISAAFSQVVTYGITASVSGSGGTVSPPSQSVNSGANASVTITPNAGYYLETLTVDSAVQSLTRTDTQTYTFTYVTSAHTLVAQFAHNPVAATYAANSNGSITGNTSQSVAYGGTATTVTAVPNAGYHFTQWSDGVLTASRTDTNVVSPISVSASFAINTYTLHYASAGNGSIVGSASQTVDYGANGSAVTASPAAGYHFVNWSDGATANPRTDVNVIANVDVTANFAVNTFTVTITTGGTGSGHVTQAPNSGSFDYNAQETLTAVADTGSTFTGWSGDCSGTTNPLVLTITTNLACAANFAAENHTLTVATSGSGDVQSGGSAFATRTLAYGTSVTLTAVPATGWIFAGWSGACSGTSTCSITMGTSDLSVTATFTITTYTLTYSAGAHGSVTGIASQTVNYSDSGTAVTARPDAGYHFVEWSDGSTANPRTDVTVTADHTVSASFAANTYTLHFDSQLGSSVPSASFETGGSVATAPTPDPTRTGYTFDGWYPATSGGSAVTFPYSPGVTSDATLYAHWFALVTYDSNTATSGTTPSDATHYAPGATVTVPDASGLARAGYDFLGWQINGTGPLYGPTCASCQAGFTLTGATTLVAAWSAAAQTIHYDVNGGGPSAPSDTVGATDSLVTLASASTISYAGRYFAGWDTSATAATPHYDQNQQISMPAGGLTLYAIWTTSPTYTVTFHANDGSSTDVLGTQTEFSQSALQAFSALHHARAGYTFAGWADTSTATSVAFTDGAQFPFTSDAGLWALWTANTNHITFNPENGTTPTAIAFTTGSTLSSLPSTPTYSSYLFDGWFDAPVGGSQVTVDAQYAPAATQDFTLYAHWHATVTYDANGATSGTVPTDGNAYQPGAQVSVLDNLNNLAIAGYQFSGWQVSGTGTTYGATCSGCTATLSLTGSVTLSAQWTPLPTHGVTYDANGATAGTVPTDANSYWSGETVTVLSHGSLQRTAYTFLNWNTQANGLGTSYADNAHFSMGAGAVTLYAQWTAKPVHVITASANAGGTLTPNGSVSVVDGDGQAFTIAASTGHHLVRMTVDGGPVGNATSYTFNTVTTDHSLTVVFAPDTFTVTTQVVGSGQVTRTRNLSSYDYGSTETLNATAPTGWIFSGWSGTGCSGIANPLVITFSGNVACTATFTQPPVVTPPVITPPGVTPPITTPPTTPVVSNTAQSPVPVPPASAIATTPTKFTLPTLNPGTSLVIATNVLPTTPGIATATLTDGNVSFTAKPGFSGKTVVPLIFTDANGVQTTVLVPVTVNPAAPTVGTFTPQDPKHTQLTWDASPNAIAYDVTINGKTACTGVTTNSCDVPGVIGPKNEIAVTALGRDGTTSTKTVPAYAPERFIALAQVHFDVNKATISAADRKVLDAFAKTVIRQGFTEVKVAAYTDGQGGARNAARLSAARAKATAAYLAKFLKVSFVKTAGGHLSPVASNTTKAGQAANRRAVVSLK